MVESLAFGIFSVLFSVVFCVLRAKKASVLSLTMKILSSICFILCGLCALNKVGTTEIGLLVIAGLVMGLVGDIVLDLKIMYPEQSDEYFVTGTGAFVVGHAFYFASAILFSIKNLPSNLLPNILISFGVAILLTLAIMLPSKKMGLNFGKMIWLSTFYCLILTFMLCFSISIAIYSPYYWIVAGGMLLFFLSDLVLSLQYFGGKSQKIWIFVNHILYYLAQSAIAISILWIA